MDVGPPCSDAVATGEYTVTVLPFLVGPHYSFRFELAADGTFAGHLNDGPLDGSPRCDGTVTPAEGERLTAAINEGQFFCRGDSIYEPTAPDASQNDFELRTTDGLRANQFCGQGVLGDDALAALNGAIGVILGRVYTSGGCMGELYEVPTRTEQCPPW